MFLALWAIQCCNYSTLNKMKVAIDNMKINKHLFTQIKLYLQKQEASGFGSQVTAC